MLVRLLYASRVAGLTCPEDLDALMSRARTYNAEQGITGILCYRKDMFLQLIEGGRDEVNALFAMLMQDSRHRDIMLLHYEEIFERKFGRWSMGKVNLDKINTTLVLKYSEKAQLDPYRMSGTVLMALLEELALSASIVGRP